MTVVASYAEQTALLFPTGGYHWAGMGEDAQAHPRHGLTLQRADRALVAAGVAEGAFQRLLAGETQIRRALTEAGWEWFGDFPLTMAAQTTVSQVLAEAFLETWGRPAMVLGESMGECAACCVAGALSLEDAVLVAYRWGQALAKASDRLGLRMAVVEDVEPEQLAPLGERLDARVVVDEARTLVVVSIPRTNLAALQDAVLALQGSVLVSSNACVAHDARLRQCEDVWEEYDAFVSRLRVRDPVLPLYSALHPGQQLRTGEQVRGDLIETTSTLVRWRESLLLLPALGIRNFVQPCAPMKAYTLDKLRSEELCLQRVRVQTARTLEGINKLGRQRNSVPPEKQEPAP